MDHYQHHHKGWSFMLQQQDDSEEESSSSNSGNSANTGTGGITVTLDMLTVALLISSVLYAFCLVLAGRRLRVLHHLRPEMSTKKLLVCSVGLVCLVRIMTILGVATMNVANVRAHYSLQPSHYHHKHHNNDNNNDNDSSNDNNNTKHQEFYDDAMTVLFDLPNSIVVSTYVLLTLVWAECFLESRFHTERTDQYQKTWLIGYMIFNSVLYATQLILYTCIFFAPSDTVVRTILYAAITGTNFTAVLLVLVLYIYLNVRFSGFPFRSEQSRRSLSRVSSVMTLWSLTRLVWGIATLLVFCYNIELLQDSHTPFWSFVVLLLLIFVCEIIPIIALLDYSYMNMIVGFERQNYNNYRNRGEEDDAGIIQPIDLLVTSRDHNNINPAAAPAVAASETMMTSRVRWDDEGDEQHSTPLLTQHAE